MRPKNSDFNINEIYQRQVNVVYRVCLSYTKNKTDTEDCVSETFMKLIKSQPHFNDTEHEKAWLIRTATNVCKNYLKHWSRKNVNLDECEDMVSVCDNLRGDTEDSDILSAVRELPETLKTAVYLYFYEGYNSVEIAEMLNKPDSTIRSYLKKAKVILKQKLQVSQETQDTQRYKEVTS